MSDRRLIHIVVQDMSGNPLPGAEVAVERTPAPVASKFLKCTVDGEAQFAIEAIGLYEFVGHAAGYESASVMAMITDTPVSLVPIALRPSE